MLEEDGLNKVNRFWRAIVQPSLDDYLGSCLDDAVGEILHSD